MQKYAIIGFAKLQVLHSRQPQQPSDWNLYCSAFAQNSNARCLVTTWQGFDDTGLCPGGAELRVRQRGIEGLAGEGRYVT